MEGAGIFSLKLVTLLGEKLSTNAYAVTLPSESGKITVMPGHEPLVTLLKPGVLAVRKRQDDADDRTEFYVLSGGIAKINQSELIVLADEAESDREISEQEAKAAYERAVLVTKNVNSQIELEEAKRLVAHQYARLEIARFRKQHKQPQEYFSRLF